MEKMERCFKRISSMTKGMLFLTFMVLGSNLIQGQTVFLDNSDHPFFGGQVDRMDEVEEKAIFSIVSEPVFEGEGAMWVEWGITQSASWGGNSSLAHSHMDPMGVYDWSDYDSLVIHYYNEFPSSMPGATHFRFCLADVSDSDNGPNIDDFSEAEYWYSFHYVLDDDIGWKKIALPLADYRVDPGGNGFDRKGWWGIEGNDALDLDMIKGFQMEFVLSASEGDIAMGSILLDHMILTTVDNDTSVFLNFDEDPFWTEGQRDREDELEKKVVASYVSEPVYGDNEGSLLLEWGITHEHDWGGNSNLNCAVFDSSGVWDLTGYDSLAFMYYNEESSSIPGAAHVRFQLHDVSHSVNGAKTYDFNEAENWYSFHHILDNDAGWQRISIPLADFRVDPGGNGFDRKGWWGIEGNDALDLDMIKGFTFEFSISANQGDVAMGILILDDIVLIGEGPTGVEELSFLNPQEYSLMQNYPNPFNSSTIIKYKIAESNHVTLKIYDILGKEIKTLVNSYQNLGQHQVHWSAEGLPSGNYFYQIKSGGFSESKKIILQK